MATLQHADSRRLYSWWWDSHISPKNSRWLQENLTDMDAKVKAMIKLIEEDADSFARRAEMYYKKRPELMKLVEEFYRAYRALAERYDHATVELRHAHRTISEAFPNQMPFSLPDDSPSGSSTTEAAPHTPEMPHPIRALLDPDDLQKDALGLSSSHFHAVKRNVAYSEESDTSTGKKGLKELNEMFGLVEVAPHANSTEGKVRKGLNFHESEGNEQGLQEGSHISTETQYLKAKVLSESETSSKAENEIQRLKVALNKLKAEKDAGLLQYQQSLERLSNLEAEISHMREEAKGLDKRAKKAETEVQNLEEALAKVEAERKAVLLQYQQCMDTISNLEAKISLTQEEAEGLNERASQAELEAQTLKQSLSRLEAEKDSGLLQYNQCLETISSLENKILHAEEDARGLNERADKAEKEAETLKQALDILNKEKEAATLQYQKCLETISKLETEISHARDEAKRLNGEVEMGVAKLNSAEKHCLLLEKSNQSLQSEVDSLSQKMEVQNQELSKKQQELEKLMICIQEEHLRFVQAEASLQTLHGLHSQSQEEHRALALQLQNGIQLLKDMEIHNHGLEEEFEQVKDENKNLKELNLSSAMSIKNLQDEIHSLRETKGKLEEEVEFRMDQRNALQQEIYCLKEEINDLSRKHRGIVAEVKSVGLDPECLGSSVKDLQDENAKLQEMCQSGREDKLALLEKLEIMEKLSEKNSLLENSLSDANAELEGLREKIKTLEESCQSLLEENSCLVPEKAALVSQLEIVSQNMEKLLEKNSFLENSLCDANAELDGLREKSKSLEESCQLLENEKSGLITERDTVVSQLKMIQQRLELLEERYTDLEERFSRLEEEKESTDTQVQELRVSLDTEKQEHAKFAQSSEARLACMEKQICHLQEEGQWMKKEFEEELEKAVNAQIEIFILQKFMQDLEEKNFSLLIECEKHFEASKLSEKVITELEHENLEQQLELKSLLNQIQKLRTGIGMVLKALETDPDCECGDKTEEDQRLLQHVLGTIEDMKNSLLSTQDEKQQMVLEKSILVTFLGQLRSEAGALETERNTLDQEKKLRTDQLLMVQGEKQEILEMSEQLRLKVMEGAHREEALKAELENLLAKLSDLQGAYVLLQYENSEVLKENGNFVKELSELKDEKCMLEDENSIVLTEALALSNLSLILKNFGTEKAMELKGLTKDVEVLHVVNGDIENKVGMLEQNLEMVRRENLHLKESVEQLEKELCSTRNDNDQLNYQTAVGKDLLSQKEAEISEAEHKIKATERERIELLENVLDLKRGYNDAEIIKEELGKKILELSEDNTNQKKEIEHLHELKGRIESELSKLREDCEEHKTREESLSSKLCERRAEAELWEACAATFYEDLQLSKIGETLFEEKVHELTRAIESLENEGTSKTVETNYLKERVRSLEEENGELKAQLAAYFPVISSLGDTITSLEQHALLRKKLSTTDSQEPRGTEDSNHMHDLSSHGLREDQSSVVPDGLLKMRELQTKVQTVEKAVMEIERLTIQEKLDSNVKLEVAVKQIEELKDQSNLHQENVHRRDVAKQTQEDELGNELDQNLKLQKTEPEISRVKNGFLMKDIPLDQISDCSPYMISKKENGEADDQMLELWETAEQFYRLNPVVGEEEKLVSASTKDNDEFHQIEAVAEQQSEYNSSELQVEKELGVDKLELSKRVPHQDVNKRKILERLESDAQKLVNLQINVQDLKSKVEMSEKSRKGKGIEYDTVKEQLQEAEEDIMKLVNFNGKLVKKLEDSPLPSDGKAGEELEETRNVRCRRISEQARRTFEKIGRLQIEVQKIQFLLLKLEDEKESKWRTRLSQRKTKVHLRDFMYTGKGDQKRKKAPFCACVRPETKGD